MKTIDNDLKFHLSAAGWYIGDSKISLVKERTESLGIEGCFNFTNTSDMAWTDGNSINLSNALGWVASLPQLDFIALHEYFHRKVDHCSDKNPLPSHVAQAQEFECDRRALKHLIESGRYNAYELYDAIAVFKDVVVEDESDTHPSSKTRYKRLLNQLKECV